MREISRIPLEAVASTNLATLIAEPDCLLLTSDPRQWAHSATVNFEIPGIRSHARILAVDLQAEAGVLGIGWLKEDQRDWVVRGSIGLDTEPAEVHLTVPAGTVGGNLVFDNWTPAGKAARARIRGIKVLESDEDRAIRAALAARADAEGEFHEALAAEERGDTEVAISRYQAALASDPAHVGSIAGLGRLRFVQPQQPLLGEMARRIPPAEVCLVTIAVRNPCNYRCFYCVSTGTNNEPVKRFDLGKIEEAYDRIEGAWIGTGFECGGGEPTVHPQFRELLKLCARYGSVSFPSNNSQNPRRWLPSDLGPRLEIRAALHPESEEKLPQYLEYAKFLRDSGCQFRCDFIAHPTRLRQIEQYADIFKTQGIPFIAIPFIGHFNGKSYPHSFTPDEQSLIEQYSPKNVVWNTVVRISSHVNRIRNFRGISCLAGYREIYIQPDGRMQRCLYDPYLIEAPLDRATACRVKSCGCGLSLERLNFQQAGLWTKLGELDQLASQLGYENAEAGVAAEYMAMYDALMAAYGKDEFPE